MDHLTTSYYSTLLLFFNTVKGSLSLIPVPLLPRLEQTFGSSLQASSLYSSHINTVSFSISQTLKLISVFWKRNNKFPLITSVLHSYFSKISTYSFNQICSGFMSPVLGKSANGKRSHQGSLQLLNIHDPKWSNIHRSQVHILWIPAYKNTQNPPTFLTALKDSSWQALEDSQSTPRGY